MKCINLKERFGRLFKVRSEESYYAERSQFRAAEAPWLMVIPCVGGEIYPHGGDTLAAFLRAGPRAERLKRLPCVQVKTVGGDGTTVLFSVDVFDQVVKIIRPRRRRRLSEAQRRACAAHLAKVRPQALPQSDSDEHHGVQVGHRAPTDVPAGSAILGACGAREISTIEIRAGR
jgi:hypothetical protein